MSKAKTNVSWFEQFLGLHNLKQRASELLAKNSRIVEAPIGTIGYR